MFYSLALLKQYNKENSTNISIDEFDVEAFCSISNKCLKTILANIKKFKTDNKSLAKTDGTIVKLIPYLFFSQDVYSLLKKQSIQFRYENNIESNDPNDILEDVLQRIYFYNLELVSNKKENIITSYQNIFLYIRMGLFGLELLANQNPINKKEILKIIEQFKLNSLIEEIESNINDIYKKVKNNNVVNTALSYIQWIKPSVDKLINSCSSSSLRLKTTKFDSDEVDTIDFKEMTLNNDKDKQQQPVEPIKKIKLNFDKLKKLTEHFESSIIGQPAVIKKINEVLISEMYNLGKSSHRPIGILFFVGPTGVGKTETVKELAKFLYGTEQIHRFDMSEYKSEVAIQKLIGAPNGYVGYQEGGTLTNAMQKNPNTIVLFDEIEKADKTVFDLFLQLLDEGVVTSNKGVKSYFDNTIVIFTSNLGVSNITARMGYENISEIIKENVEYFFNHTINRPELLGRIGKENIIVFNLIHEQSDLFKILDIQFKPFIKQYEEKNIKLKFDKEALYKEILKNIDLTKGARDIRNKFEQFKKHLHTSFFEKELNVDKMKGNSLEISYKDEKVNINITKSLKDAANNKQPKKTPPSMSNNKKKK